ncbi:MAG TPA: S24 family peptidase [Candidatus Saccharimonadales bacterium]|nr:S24 family peptidase [Candidatus Saccharimonadales bacterium]
MSEHEPGSGVSIHAGFPNPAADKTLTSLDLNQLLVRRATSTFLFRVHGASGEAYGIFDGDLAIVDRALDPRKTDLVVWWDEDTFRISRFDALGKDAAPWGVITSTVRQLRKDT